MLFTDGYLVALYCRYSIAQPGVVQLIVDELSFTFSFNQISLTQNAKMLRSDGLFQIERTVDLINIYQFVLIDKLENAHTEGMGQRPEDFRRNFQITLIDPGGV